MSYDPVARARQVLGHFGFRLLVRALDEFPRSSRALFCENLVAPALISAILALVVGFVAESGGMRNAGLGGILACCLGTAIAGICVVRIEHERIWAAWAAYQGLRRGWLDAERRDRWVRLIDRDGIAVMTLRADHVAARWVLEAYPHRCAEDPAAAA